MNEIQGFRFHPEDAEKIADALRKESTVGVAIECPEDVRDVIHDVRRYGLYRVEEERMDIHAKNSDTIPDFYGRLTFVINPEQIDRNKESDKRYIDFFLTDPDPEEEENELFWI